MNSKVRQKLAKALLFMDQNLVKKMTAAQIAQYACISEFHFQRLFRAYLGETVSQYILHRRLEIAAKEIVDDKNQRITDIAIKSGFETHSAFSRAFKKQFALSPSEFRKTPKKAKLGSDKTRPYLKTIAPKNKSINVIFEDLPTLWLNHKYTKYAVDGTVVEESVYKVTQGFETILNANKPKFFGLVSSGAYSSKPKSINDCHEFILYGGIYHSKHDDSWSADWLEIEAGLWAVFTHKGRYEFSYQTWSNFIRSWLPDSGYELRETVAFELYEQPPETVASPDDFSMQIYVPIKKMRRTATWMKLKSSSQYFRDSFRGDGS
jgi:AraC-like DNA-binding protein/predicted transcriptional regulator YdeE